MTIRSATLGVFSAIKAIAVDTRMFDLDEVEVFDELLGAALDGWLDDHEWIVDVGDCDEVLGAACYASEPFSDRLWKLYFLSAAPARQSDRINRSLSATAR